MISMTFFRVLFSFQYSLVIVGLCSFHRVSVAQVLEYSDSPDDDVEGLAWPAIDTTSILGCVVEVV